MDPADIVAFGKKVYDDGMHCEEGGDGGCPVVKQVMLTMPFTLGDHYNTDGGDSNDVNLKIWYTSGDHYSIRLLKSLKGMFKSLNF